MSTVRANFQVAPLSRVLMIVEVALPILLLVLGIYHGFVQTLYRAGIIQSSSFAGLGYYQGLTLHGVINAVVLTTFFGVAFGNAVMQYYLRQPLFPTVHLLSTGLMGIGTLIAAVPMLLGLADVLYTFYPPLKAHPAFYIGATLLVVGSWIAFFGWIPLIRRWMREHPGQPIPLAVLGMLTAFIIWFACTIPLAIEVLFMLIPWSLGWIDTINIPLARTLFWFFGHPLVYFWLLPTYVVYYVMLPKEAGGKLYSAPAARLVFLLFLVLSIPVGLHHQYTEPGFERFWKGLHALLTFGVAIPSFITAFTVAASLEHAGVQRGATGLFGWIWKLPWFDANRPIVAYSLAGLLIFILGGLTGLVNASYNLNQTIHNTGFISGHFHMTVGGPVFLIILGLSLELFSQLTGKPVRGRGWNIAVPYLWALGLYIFSPAMMIGGLLGQPRRTNMGLSYLDPSSPHFRLDWVVTSYIAAIGGAIMFLAFLIYVGVWIATIAAPAEKPAGLLYLSTAESLHSDVPTTSIMAKLRPWLAIAVLLIIVSYWAPLRQAMRTPENAPPYAPDNPTPAIQVKK
ncbi:MAG: cbb3-type cytochrome c oxidase subunit I [Bacteroidia bacterium]|nr:cbb3-type cytochrome c oxidase subunit I [Bacteroidia bacterium]MDW8015675.1 cbb3-type cytochrome c oxidase subunit I [Bacteroidia bacterium]